MRVLSQPRRYYPIAAAAALANSNVFLIAKAGIEEENKTTSFVYWGERSGAGLRVCTYWKFGTPCTLLRQWTKYWDMITRYRMKISSRLRYEGHLYLNSQRNSNPPNPATLPLEQKMIPGESPCDRGRGQSAHTVALSGWERCFLGCFGKFQNVRCVFGVFFRNYLCHLCNNPVTLLEK